MRAIVDWVLGMCACAPLNMSTCLEDSPGAGASGWAFQDLRLCFSYPAPMTELSSGLPPCLTSHLILPRPLQTCHPAMDLLLTLILSTPPPILTSKNLIPGAASGTRECMHKQPIPNPLLKILT